VDKATRRPLGYNTEEFSVMEWENETINALHIYTDEKAAAISQIPRDNKLRGI
jgi:hypothetical protein